MPRGLTHPPSSWFRFRAAWLLLLASVVLLIAAKAPLEWRYRRLVAMDRAAAEAKERLAQGLWDQYHAARDALHADVAVDQALAKIHRKPTSDQITPEGDRRIVAYDAPELGVKFRFSISIANPSGSWSANGSRSTPPRGPAPERPTIERSLGTLARWLTPGGWPLATLPWLALLIWSWRDRPRRAALAFALTAWACFAAAVFVLAPFRSIPVGSLLLLIATAGALVQLARRRDHAPLSCAVCEYPLVGNTTGVCSECGTPIDTATRKKIAMARV